ncbi:uncharacterized protein LOC132948874 [Metopolophium dirhodum]|uniref:uncharacterized protein LOC132948874 n=1 Tax=Metopolophium dirhodum TaxID=44670 RepID=UPI00298FE807|nr:uncharacterized protein LOC132948874 [Metopolophium dirhodum]
MTSVFMETLNLFITASKIFGLMNYCCTMESGLLYRNTKSTYYIFLECIRMFVYLIFSYHIIFNMGCFYILVDFNIIKYWAIVITARISEKWIIKFINGIIKFDNKLLLFNSSIPVKLYSKSKTFWNVIFASFFLYFLCCQYFLILQFGRRIKDLSDYSTVVFHSPDIIIFIVMITSLYYLSNLGYRFCELNRLWKCLPFGLLALPGGWTNSEITVLVERIRLLHAELSELLRLFSLGYGPVLLVYFTFTFAHALIETFLFTIYKDSLRNNIFPYIFYLQHIFNMISIIYITAWVIEKKKKIISCLRLIRISEMTIHTKLQIKIFMNQISMYEPNEITAFGFFNFDVKLTMSILVLLITAISTMLQMKDHPWMLYLKNAWILNVYNNMQTNKY